jgi:chromate reductase
MNDKETHIHVLGFAGSLRKASYNRALLRAARELLPENMSLEIFDLSPIPLYNADVEHEGTPEAAQQFKRRIAAADALLIVTPEYNWSVPGVLKNALDWASRRLDADHQKSALDDKPVAMMGAGGGSGTIRAQMHLRQIVAHNNMLLLNKPTVYVSHPHEKFDEQLCLIHEPTRQRIRLLMSALGKWTRWARDMSGEEQPR